MIRFSYASSIVLASLALVACGDDTASTGTGGAGGQGTTTSDASSSANSASNSVANSASNSASNGSGGGETGTGGAPGTGGDDPGTGGAPGTGGGDPGTGGASGTGGSEPGACAAECENPDELEQISAGCGTCAQDNAASCASELNACLQAQRAKGDTEGCDPCGEIAQSGSLANICESNQDEADAVVECVCSPSVCG